MVGPVCVIPQVRKLLARAHGAAMVFTSFSTCHMEDMPSLRGRKSQKARRAEPDAPSLKGKTVRQDAGSGFGTAILANKTTRAKLSPDAGRR
jgi:hypothetical protein